MPLSSSPNKIETLWGVTFHSPAGRNNQKGQNVNSHLLPFSPFTVLLPGAAHKNLSVPGSHFFHPTSTSLALHEPLLSSSWPSFPASPPRSLFAFLSGCLKSLLRITLCPWRRSPHCFPTHHALALPLISPHLTSSLLALPPLMFIPRSRSPSLSLFVFHSCGCCCIVNTSRPAAS